MDWFLILTFSVVAVVIFFNILIFFINNYIYPTINPSNNMIINAGLANDGKNGVDGYDGLNGPVALSGANGDNGNKGLDGRDGKVGVNGKKGEAGSPGSAGLTGSPGEVGERGLPSNSNVSIINRFDMENTDSYTLIDNFSFENKKYQVMMSANIENNSRFVLKFGEDIVLPQAGFSTSFSTSLPVTTIDGGSFYSNLRIAIGYGRGKMDSTLRSDDTIFYVSPPISRRSFLFRYKMPSTVPNNFQYLSIKYPISPLNNTKDFYFYESAVLNSPLDHELTLWKYHLFKGLGKYEIVVNTFPPLPGNYKFNYRIIEEFTKTNSQDFALPKIIFPFNTNVISFNNPGETKLTISNRFDLDRVVERSYDKESIAWIQTQKKNVKISTGEINTLVPYDNTYQSLNDDEQISQTALQQVNYYQDPNGIPDLISDNLALKLRGTFKNAGVNGTSEVDLEVVFGMRNYVPKVPLDKFKNTEKFYLRMTFSPRGFPVPMQDHIFTYGEEFSFDLIDFQTVYSKSIFIADGYLVNPDSMTQEITTFNPLYPPSFVSPTLATLPFLEIEVGYTEYSTKDRYTTFILPQKKNPFCYYFNIPLYGYKKK